QYISSSVISAPVCRFLSGRSRLCFADHLEFIGVADRPAPVEVLQENAGGYPERIAGLQGNEWLNGRMVEWLPPHMPRRRSRPPFVGKGFRFAQRVDLPTC
ncbi:MAG: hypothetical protein KDN05_25260, partial [Verrucomicrobiae bacterium]|nr:hypothetical protein [Verrucomicrobiae bacterium]